MRKAALLLALTACGPAPAPSIASHPVATASASAVPIEVAPVPKKDETPAERATRLHGQAIIVDGHNDVPMLMLRNGTNIDKPAPKSHTDLARMKASGITGEFFSIYVPKELAPKGSLEHALSLIDVTYRQVERYPDDLILATSVADIRRAKVQGKIAVLMGIEGGHAIENSLAALREMYRLGVRYMTLTHSNTNDWADSAGFSGPTPVKHHGLAPFGEEVVKEMQRIGMFVDISHVSDETFWATLKVAKAPVIASHSSARALSNNRRNLTDEMLQALAKNGGVCMVNYWSRFLVDDFGTPNAKKATLGTLVDHIEHIVKVAGIDHVGLGSDFDGVDVLPEGIDGIESLPKITEELVKRGYSDADILKILGENFLRAFGEIESYSKSTHTRLSGDGSLEKIRP